jgi:hypothetical protein
MDIREVICLMKLWQFCKEKGVEFYAVNQSMPDLVDDKFSSRKVTADLVIDDRNLGGLPDWGVIYQMIKSGKPLEKASNYIENEYPTTKKSILQRIFNK